MKCIIAASAYYFTTGPWRNCWVRFGHDPRQEPQDSKYQILDYRIMHTLRSRVTPKRSYSGYAPHKFGSSYRTKPSSIRQQQEAGSASQERTEGSFAFRPGFIPKCRQMFYQAQLFCSSQKRSFPHHPCCFSDGSCATCTFRKSKRSCRRRSSTKRALSATDGFRPMWRTTAAGSSANTSAAPSTVLRPLISFEMIPAWRHFLS